MSLLPVALAVLAGIIIAAQGPIYSRMTQGLSHPLNTTLLAFATATMVLVTLHLVTRTGLPSAAQVKALPLWVWVGGVLGICVVLLSIAAVPRLGAAGYIVAVIAGQLTASLLFDQFGAFGLSYRPITWQALAGVGLIGAGATLVIWR
jgi:transporter family-2 protein